MNWNKLWDAVKVIWANMGIIGTINGLTGNAPEVKTGIDENGERHTFVQTRNEAKQAEEIAAAEKNYNEKLENETNKLENPNLETNINGLDYNNILNQSLEWQKAQWEREDEIRKETQEREDNAIQRKVADMRAAGVNPNLAYSMSGAESGGGITNATEMNTSVIEQVLGNMNEEKLTKYKTEMEKALKEWELLLEQGFDKTENSKDRANDILTKIISIASILAMVA